MIPASLSLLAYCIALLGALRGHRSALMAGGIVAVLLHATALVGDLFADGLLLIGVVDALSLVFWQAAVLTLLAWRHLPITALTCMVFPLAGLAAIAAAWPEGAQAGEGIHDNALKLHVGLSVFAAGLFTLAAMQSLLVAVQNRALHGAHDPPALLRSLPPLQSMESALFGALWLAWGVLSAALLTGIVFVDDLFDQHLVHKTLLSVTSWAVFLMLLWGHWRYGWRGRTALRWTWTGYAVLLLAYFGSKFVLEELLGQRWG
ncbi:cytochrome C assembly family protein [Algiphilus sp.]|uniref:cytochrome C assembly family protein n=1 Tax=Algiphilus sp. TaxID=1872431 RepID=UPI003B52B4F8